METLLLLLLASITGCSPVGRVTHDTPFSLSDAVGVAARPVRPFCGYAVFRTATSAVEFAVNTRTSSSGAASFLVISGYIRITFWVITLALRWIDTLTRDLIEHLGRFTSARVAVDLVVV